MSPLIPLFFSTALIYSMAGFGGGSTYLALLVLFQFPFQSIAPMALICNVAVVSFGFWQFSKKGHFLFKKIFPFVVTSIPMAYWGGTISLGRKPFTLLLGISLTAAALRLFWVNKPMEPLTSVSMRKIWLIGLPLGALLGFLAGLVGIGGGIYLAPVLLFLGWVDVKQAAAASSFFILVNSLSGLMGQATKGPLSLPIEIILPLLFAVILGGQVGSRWGSGSLPKLALQRVTATLILWAAGRLLWGIA